MNEYIEIEIKHKTIQNETIDYSFDPENFKRVPFQKYDHDFTIFFNGNPYKTNRFIADILSLIICKLGNIDEYFRLQSSFFGPLSTENCVSLLLTIEKVYSQNLEDFSIEN